MANNAKIQALANLRLKVGFIELLNQLMIGENILLDDKNSPPWFQEGVIYQVSKTVYVYHLEILPPRWMDGLKFAFGEGHGPFQLFWQTADEYFGRQLSHEETFHFCRLSGTRLCE